MVQPTPMPDGSDVLTPIVPVTIGDDWQAVLFWKALYDEGVYANVALYPAVPRGGALLRTSVMATHERDHLDRALEAFDRGEEPAGRRGGAGHLALTGAWRLRDLPGERGVHAAFRSCCARRSSSSSSALVRRNGSATALPCSARAAASSPSTNASSASPCGAAAIVERGEAEDRGDHPRRCCA